MYVAFQFTQASFIVPQGGRATPARLKKGNGKASYFFNYIERFAVRRVSERHANAGIDHGHIGLCG